MTSKHEQHRLGDIIKAKRKELRMTQIQLSEKLQVSLASLQQIEQGHTPSEKMRKTLTNWLQS